MKTKKLSKQILSLFVLAVISFCLAFAVMPSNLVRASEQSSTQTYSTFTAVDGASVRMGMGTDEDPFGIRFTTTIPATDYQSIIDTYPGQEVTFGTIIGRNVTDMEDFKAKGTKVERSVWDEKYNPGKASNEYRYNLVIMNLQGENLNTPYTALGYYAVGGEVKGYAENAVTRTPLQVLTVEMTKTAEDLEDVENLEKNQENLLAMIDTAMANAEFKFTNSELTVGCYQEVTPELTVNGAKVTPILTVEDNGVAEVTANGAIKGLKGGSATVTATILSATGSNYTATATVNVTKGEVKPVVNADGTLALNTNGEETTVKVNGTAVDGTYSADTLNIVDYILDNNTITAETDFTISVSSAGLEGSVTHKFIPVTNANFKTKIATATADNKSTRHYFLTENVSFTSSDVTKKWIRQAILQGVHAHLDGRGYSMSYDITTTSDAFVGFVECMNATWSNIYFDLDLTFTGKIAGVLTDSHPNRTSGDANGVINCYFDINVTAVEPTVSSVAIFSCGAGLIKDNIFNIKATDGISVSVADSSATNSPVYDNNIVISNYENYQFVTSVVNNKTVGRQYLYTSVNAMLNGGNHKTMGNTEFTSYTAVDTTDAPVYNYSTFDTNVWSFDKENGIIKLCGREVYNKSIVVAVDLDGIVTFDTKGETATVTVDGTPVSAENGKFDLTAWAFENGLNADKTYTVKVESSSYAGEITKTYKALNNENFKSTIDEYNTAENAGIYFYLTENVTLPNTGLISHNPASAYKVHTVFETTYITLDGRGHTVGFTFSYGNWNSAGIMYTHCGNWKNLVFDINATYADLPRCAFAYKVVTDSESGLVGSLVNCYFDLDVSAGKATAYVITEATSARIENCIFDISIAETATIGISAVGTLNAGVFNNNIYINSKSNEPIDVITGNLNSTGLLYRYTSIANFLNGVDGEKGSWTSSSSSFRVSDYYGDAQISKDAFGTSETPAYAYTNWDSVWNISASGITLCGQTVYTPAQ
ncbi:MAG: hypothetical protein IJA88_01030 [Clostridia bacterium]|nr:hypothetical protein [Clostridia bacterium]